MTGSNTSFLAGCGIDYLRIELDFLMIQFLFVTPALGAFVGGPILAADFI